MDLQKFKLATELQKQIKEIEFSIDRIENLMLNPERVKKVIDFGYEFSIESSHLKINEMLEHSLIDLIQEKDDLIKKFESI